jgi:hypothetical protein
VFVVLLVDVLRARPEPIATAVAVLRVVRRVAVFFSVFGVVVWNAVRLIVCRVYFVDVRAVEVLQAATRVCSMPVVGFGGGGVELRVVVPGMPWVLARHAPVVQLGVRREVERVRVARILTL